MNLFNRYRFCTVDEKEPGTWEAVSSFADTFHEMKVLVIARREEGYSLQDTRAFTLLSVTGEMMRCPNSLCLDTLQKLKQLQGLKLEPPVRRRIRDVIGGPNGCRQLEDLVLDAVQGFFQAEFFVRGRNISAGEERRRHFHKEMKNSCYLHSQQS